MAKKAPDILGNTLNAMPKPKPKPAPKPSAGQSQGEKVKQNRTRPSLDPAALKQYGIQTTPERMKQLRVYAAQNDLKLNEAIEQALALLLD